MTANPRFTHLYRDRALFMRVLLLIAFSVVTIMTTVTAVVTAQSAPEQIQDALALFNQEQGTNLTLNDFYWTWEQIEADDSSLGCPKPGETYTPGRVVVFRFLFTYNNTIYDYRVSADRTITRSCGGIAEDAPTATLPPNVTATPDPNSNRLCGSPTPGIVYIRTRLAPTLQARVLPNGVSNLRAEAAVSAALVRSLPGGTPLEIVSGPVCDSEGYLWWQVEADGALGYVAEGQGEDYFIEPLPPVNLPTNPVVIEPGNAALIGELAKLQGNIAGSLAWMRDDKLLTVGAVGSEGVWVYDTLGGTPRLLGSADRLTRVAVSDGNTLAMVGGEDGAVRLWDVRAEAEVVERVFLNGHDDPVDAIAFQPSGGLMASVGGLAYTAQNDAETDTNAILIWDVDAVTLVGVLRGHTDTVTALAFAGDDLLISSGLDGSVRVWNVGDYTQMGMVGAEVGATSLAISLTANLVVAGYADGKITAYQYPALTPGVPLIAHTGSVNEVAFNPQGTLLASVGGDGRLVLWTIEGLPTADNDSVQRFTPSGGHDGSATRVVFNPDGTVLATLGADRLIRLWGVVDSAG